MANRLRRLIRPRRSRPGTAPGTILVDKNAPPPSIDVFQFNRDNVDRAEGISPSEIPPLSDDVVTWVNVVGLGDAHVIEAIADRFDIHDLALEDVVNTHQRPKMEQYSDHLYVVLRMPNDSDIADLEQVSIFLGKNYVLTWQEADGDCFQPIRERLQSKTRLVRKHGADFLAYALIDSIIDSFFPVLTRYGERLDAIEDRVTSANAGYSVVQSLHQIRSDLRTLRRSTWAHRDVVRNLMSTEDDLLTEMTLLHLRDVSDHTVQLVELFESSRDSCSDLQDLYMSAVSLRTNEVMKVLTIIATIFIPLGFIAGLYGMNFSYDASPLNMPETQWYFGYPMAIVLMGSVAFAMLAFFYRRGWIGSDNGKDLP
ncbi:MAG: magnesium/cobalt transporter CorA [Pirellulaceae bacterium]|nr:magnesium/cobalt transporter CorA [Pirellulaceae bacterium]